MDIYPIRMSADGHGSSTGSSLESEAPMTKLDIVDHNEGGFCSSTHRTVRHRS